MTESKRPVVTWAEKQAVAEQKDVRLAFNNEEKRRAELEEKTARLKALREAAKTIRM